MHNTKMYNILGTPRVVVAIKVVVVFPIVDVRDAVVLSVVSGEVTGVDDAVEVTGVLLTGFVGIRIVFETLETCGEVCVLPRVGTFIPDVVDGWLGWLERE